MQTFHEIIPGSRENKILLDISLSSTTKKQPVVIFCHGYKGFKDWGAWNLVAKEFAANGFVFIKFNFSYNGTTIEEPMDFMDIQSFGENNYTTELNDLGLVLDWVLDENDLDKYLDKEQVFLIGHSRGGGIALLKTAEDTRVKKVTTWAGVSDYYSRIPVGEELENWKKNGVLHVVNSRTNQRLPHFYDSFYLDTIYHKERLNIEARVKEIEVPIFVVHGTEDTAVLPAEAENIHSWNTRAQLHLVKDANHTFGSSHPYKEKELPAHLNEVVQQTIAFCIFKT